MKKTRLNSVASLLATGVLMGGCMADVGGQSESEGDAAQGPNVGEAKQALQAPIAGTWTAWRPLGGATPNSPAIASRGNGTFDVFVLGMDNNIYIKNYANGAFGPWASLGAPAGLTFVSAPDAVSSDANSVSVVARANDGKFYLRTWTATSGWSGWGSLPGTFTTHGPAMSSRGPGILDVFGTGLDNQTWQTWLTGGTWNCCGALGSPLNQPPKSNVTSVSWNSSAVHLFVRGADNSLWSRWWDGATWYPTWHNLGGQFTSGMGVASWAPAHLDVFGVGTDSQIWQTQYDAGWSHFTPLGFPPGGLAAGSSPDAVSSGPGRIDLIVRGSDNQPWVRSFTSFTVGGIRRTPQVSGSYHQGVAVKSDGTVWVVATAPEGHLGSVQVNGLTDVVAVTSAYSYNLALKSDGTVWTWSYASSPATRVEGLTDVVAVEAGDNHALALKKDGTLWAWGSNSQGQLGDGTTTSSPTPKPVMTDVVSVSAGENHTLAAKRDGTVWSWGANNYHKLGYVTGGYGYNSNPTPQQVPNLTGIVQVSAAWEHSAALKSDGTVWTWGGNRFNQLGDATVGSRATPAQIPGLTGVVSIDAGYYATYQLALKADGTLWNWNSEARRTVMNDVVAMSAGYGRALGVKSDGTLWTWVMTNSTQELVATVPVKL